MTGIAAIGIDTVIKELTPMLQVQESISAATVSDLFSFLDSPFGHPVLFGKCRCFYQPLMLYFRAETRVGLFQVESFENCDDITDELAHILDLYPNILDLSLQDVSVDSFVAIKWSRIYPDSADADVVIYSNLYCDFTDIEEGKFQPAKKFDLEQPRNRPSYFKTGSSLSQYLAASAALRLEIRQVTDTQSEFDLLCRYAGHPEIPVDVDLVRRFMSLATAHKHEKMESAVINEVSNASLQFLINMIYIRYLRKQIRQFHRLQPEGKEKLQFILPFTAGKCNLGFSCDCASDINGEDVENAIIDCIRNTFRAEVEQSQNFVSDVRFMGVAHELLSNKRKSIAIQEMALCDVSEGFALDQLAILIVMAVDQFIQASQHDGMRQNSYLTRKLSLSAKKRAFEVVETYSSDFFSEPNALIRDENAFDETDLAQICQEQFHNIDSVVGTIRLPEIGHFLTGDGAYDDEKDNIRHRLGELYGFEINIKVEIRTGSKKWGLKKIE